METIVVPKGWWQSKVYQGVIVGSVSSLYGIIAKHQHWGAWDDSYAELVVQLLQLFGIVWTAIGLRLAKHPIGDPSKPVVTPAVQAGTASGEVPVGSGLEPGHVSGDEALR